MKHAIREPLRRLLMIVPLLAGVVALVHPLARLGARWDWRLDLMSHFQEPALAATCLAAVLLSRRHQRATMLFLVLAIFQLEPVVRHSLPKPGPVPLSDGPRLRILMANLFVDNTEYQALVDLVHRTQPDIVGLVEFSEEWYACTRTLAQEYPYRIEAPNGSRGLALWFKKPPTKTAPPARPTSEGWPFLHATFDFAGRSRNIWLLHPAAPFSRNSHDSNFGEFRAIGDRIRDSGGSSIVIGDLNTTDGSPHFDDFLANTNLRDSRRGFGRQPTWPIWFPYKIAIDHVLLTPDLFVVDRRRESEIGSDHLPILVDLAPAPIIAASTSVTAGASSSR